MRSALLLYFRLLRENDNLVGKYSKHSQQLQNEVINLPDNVEVSYCAWFPVIDEIVFFFWKPDCVAFVLPLKIFCIIGETLPPSSFTTVSIKKKQQWVPALNI